MALVYRPLRYSSGGSLQEDSVALDQVGSISHIRLGGSDETLVMRVLRTWVSTAQSLLLGIVILRQTKQISGATSWN